MTILSFSCVFRGKILAPSMHLLGSPHALELSQFCWLSKSSFSDNQAGGVQHLNCMKPTFTGTYQEAVILGVLWEELISS